MVVEEIKALKELLDMGAITQDEFDARKRGLLSQSVRPQLQMQKTQFETFEAPYNTMCIAGITVSGASLLINLFGITGIVGIVLSIIGLSSCKRRGERGRGLAIAGIAMGASSIVIMILVLAFIL